MRELFPGYCRKSESEIKKIWEKGLIIFDANVLLNLYRYSKATRKTILDLIGKFKERICLPHQAALEYNRNRYEVISDQEKAYKEFTDKISQIQKDLQTTSKPPFLSESVHKDLNKVFEKVNTEVEDSIKTYGDYLKDDPIYNKISELFDGKITDMFSPENLDEIFKEGEERYKAKIPPGYEDEKNKEGNRKYGDLVLWKQVIEKAKKEKTSVIFITDERKTDWWWKIKDGRNMGPRQELVEEISRKANVDFHMYSSERFLSYGQSFFEEKVNQKALEEIQEIKRSELEQLKKIRHISQREFKRELMRNDEFNMLRHKERELMERQYEIKRKQESLRDDARENIEAQEFIQSLSIEQAEIEQEIHEINRRMERLELKARRSRHGRAENEILSFSEYLRRKKSNED